MVRYIKCPRCELNYINAEAQELCDVCLKEVKGIRTDLDFIEEEEDVPTELCPVCGENMMRVGEKMCEECRKREEYEPSELDSEEDDEWREYLDDTTELDDDLVDIGEKFDEPEEEEEEEEEVYEGDDEEEDLEYVTGDEIYELSGEDDEDDEEDDDF